MPFFLFRRSCWNSNVNILIAQREECFQQIQKNSPAENRVGNLACGPPGLTCQPSYPPQTFFPHHRRKPLHRFISSLGLSRKTDFKNDAILPRLGQLDIFISKHVQCFILWKFSNLSSMGGLNPLSPPSFFHSRNTRRIKNKASNMKTALHAGTKR